MPKEWLMVLLLLSVWSWTSAIGPAMTTYPQELVLCIHFVSQFNDFGISLLFLNNWSCVQRKVWDITWRKIYHAHASCAFLLQLQCQPGNYSFTESPNIATVVERCSYPVDIHCCRLWRCPWPLEKMWLNDHIICSRFPMVFKHQIL
jgi:hypothetical protein